MEATVTLVLPALFGQQADSIMNVAAFASYGIHIAGIE